MKEHERWMVKWAFGLICCGCGLFIGCTSQPKETAGPQPSVQDVRGDSDRFFHKVEEEEKAQLSP